jgi:hypothetical protein
VDWRGVVMSGRESARELAQDLLHESVDDEWSFIETLRHLALS